jgi:transposase
MEKLNGSQRRGIFLEHYRRGERKASRLAIRAGLSITTARRLIKMIERGEDLKPKYRAHTKRKFTATVRRQLAQILARNPRKTSKWLALELGRRNGVRYSDRGVRKVLHGMGYHHGRPKRYSLTAANKQSRLSYAHEHIHTDWNRIWSYDECYFNLNLGSKEDSVSLCIAVAISYNRKSTICFLPKNYSPGDLVHVLETELLPSIHWDPNVRRFRAFLMDNDGRHHNRQVINCLRTHDMDRIGYMPPNSPDINPVENLFSVMKNFVRERLPQNEAELRTAIHDAWEDIDKQTLNDLFDSMSERMQLVIDHAGDRIPY